ncbi:tetratricopeptide repeat protein [candidate division WWE3 bacterium]|nr:tetratricopeptide repeat protein [candidate division WWE3 bacterium]
MKRTKAQEKLQNTNIYHPYVQFSTLYDVKQFLLTHLDFITLFTFLIFAVYLNSLSGKYISDDIVAMNFVANNNWLESIKEGRYYYAVYKTIYTIFRGESGPFHLLSIFGHTLATIFGFIFVSQYFSKKIAMLATLIFALHPINTEAVSWISGNIYITDAIILFISITLNNLYSKSTNFWYYILMLCLFSVPVILGLNVRSLAIIPCLIVVDIFFNKKKINWQFIFKYIPYLIISSIVLLKNSLYAVNRITELNYATPDGEKTNYFYQLIYSIYNPLELLIFPKKLALYHEGNFGGTSHIPIMATITILLFIYIFINLRIDKLKAGLILFALSSFCFALSPIQIAWYYADRYLYITTLVFGILLAQWLTKLEGTLRLKNLAVITTIIILGIYAGRIYIRNLDWRDSKSIWEANVKTHPLSSRSFNNLGDVYLKEGDVSKSLSAFKKAIEINPYYSDAYHNLGATQIQIGDYEEAKKNLEQAFFLNKNLYICLMLRQ